MGLRTQRIQIVQTIWRLHGLLATGHEGNHQVSRRAIRPFKSLLLARSSHLLPALFVAHQPIPMITLKRVQRPRRYDLPTTEIGNPSLTAPPFQSLTQYLAHFQLGLSRKLGLYLVGSLTNGTHNDPDCDLTKPVEITTAGRIVVAYAQFYLIN